MRRLVIPLLLAMLVGSVSRVAAAVFCRRKSGVIVSRDTRCRRKEQAIALDVTGPPGPPGAKGANGPPGKPPMVLDARGTVVGAYFDGWAVRHVDGQALALPVEYSAAFDDPCYLAFGTDDCSGPPILMPYQFGIAPNGLAAPVIVRDMIGYYPSGPKVPQTVHTNQYCTSTAEQCRLFNPAATFTPPNRCCAPAGVPGGYPVTAEELRTVDFRALGLVPPFHLEGIP